MRRIATTTEESMNELSALDSAWPELPYRAWADTCTTLHLWTQIVGKIRSAKCTWVNHSWHVALYVTTRGLTTSPIPGCGSDPFQDVQPGLRLLPTRANGEHDGQPARIRPP